MRRQVSCPFNGTGETLVLHAFIFTLLHTRLKDKILNRVAASIPKFNLLLIPSCKQFFCSCRSQIFEIRLIFYGFNSYTYFAILSYILLMRHENILHLISIYLQTSSFIVNQYGFCVFSYNVPVFKTSAQKKFSFPS
jgi:uncharacterized membrane protein